MMNLLNALIAFILALVCVASIAALTIVLFVGGVVLGVLESIFGD